MNVTGCDLDLDLLRSIFKGFLLDDLKNLKDLICCDGGGGGTPAPGVDDYVNALDITETTLPTGGKTVQVTLTRTDGVQLSKSFEIPPATGSGNDLHITDFTVTKDPNIDSPHYHRYNFVLTRNDSHVFEQHLEVVINNIKDITFDPQTRVLTHIFDDNTTKEVTIPGGGGGSGGNIRSFSTEVVDTPLDRYSSGVPFVRKDNKYTIVDGGGETHSITAPNNSFEIIGYRNIPTPRFLNLLNVKGGAEVVVAASNGGVEEVKGIEAPIYWVDPKIEDNKLTLTTYQYVRGTPSIGRDAGGANSPFFSVAGRHVIYEEEITLPTGGGSGVTWNVSAGEPEKTTGTKLPTTMFGGRDQVLGTPYKWIEIEVEGEQVLMPVWRKP